MKDFSQRLIDGLDKTTNNGFAEALLLAISQLRNKEGLLIGASLSDDPAENIRYARDVARMMLHKSA